MCFHWQWITCILLRFPLGIKSLQLPVASRRAAILVEAFGAEGATPFFPKDERQGILHSSQFHQPKSKIARSIFCKIQQLYKYIKYHMCTTKWMGCWIFRIRQLLRDALNEAKDPLGSYLEDQAACFYLKDWQVSNWRKWVAWAHMSHLTRLTSLSLE